MQWTLSYNNTTKTLAEWGIYNLSRSTKNLLTDKVTFDIKCVGIGAGQIFSANTNIQIFKDSVKWFEGIVTQTPAYCSAKKSYQTYEISGAWWYLENLIYQQTWKEPVDSSAPTVVLTDIYKGHLILGQDVDGKNITIGEQITDVINYAISCGMNLSLNPIDINVNIPYDECKDLSCSDVIRRLLRWVPDVVCNIDYSKVVPEMFLKRRAQMPSFVVNLNIYNITEFSVQPRYDLQMNGVVLKFEQTNTVNGKSWKSTFVQKYPQDAPDKSIKSLVLTVNLEGAKSNYITQELSVEPVESTSVAWWRKHIAALESVNLGSISINDVSRQSTLPNEIIKGNIADWMGFDAATDIITAKISYSSDDESVIDRNVAVKINVTDASSNTYKKLVSLVTADIIPDDLAYQIYLAVNVLQFDGYIKFANKELSKNLFGTLLNIDGYDEALSSMNAVIQEVVEKIDTGETYIKFGPAKHLGAQDLAELTRSSRTRFDCRNSMERKTAEASGNGLVEQSTRSRLENTSFGPGKYKKIKFIDPVSSSKSIVIDSEDLSHELSVHLRTEDVSDSGVLKKRYSLSSEPYVEQ